jgi:hypothetical protein
MNQDFLNQLQAQAQAAQHQVIWVWIVLAVVQLVALALAGYFLYWAVELMKATIRTLDRWRPAGGPSFQEQRPMPPPPAGGVIEALKYGPKAR